MRFALHIICSNCIILSGLNIKEYRQTANLNRQLAKAIKISMNLSFDFNLHLSNAIYFISLHFTSLHVQ